MHKIVNEINAEARVIAMNLDLADRIEIYGNSNAFITLKDHKENFENSTIDGLSRTQNSQESIAIGAVIMGSELFYVKHRLLKP